MLCAKIQPPIVARDNDVNELPGILDKSRMTSSATLQIAYDRHPCTHKLCYIMQTGHENLFVSLTSSWMIAVMKLIVAIRVMQYVMS